MKQIRDKSFVPFIESAPLQERIKALAQEVNKDYAGKNPLLIGVLNGSFMFVADLFKSIEIACEITFIRVSSYQSTESTGKVKQILGLKEEIQNRDIIIVEDIVDTGMTMQEILGQLASQKPASIKIMTMLFKPEASQSLRSKISRRLFPSPNGSRFDRKTIKSLCAAIDDERVEFAFLNNVEALSLAPRIGQLRPNCKLVYLSHGVELTDVVNNLRLTPEIIPRVQRNSKWMGRLLLDEVRCRQYLFGTICISQEDMLFEQWLGSPKVMFLPRRISDDRISRSPLGRRIGCVSTLNHGPNLHGLRLLLEQLDRVGEVSLRLVGGPVEVGADLAEKYDCLDYLGPLANDSLKREASTWWAFVNPIFCTARGASTKVATALGWGVPVLTTPQGKRGYNWPASIPTYDSASSLAIACKLACQESSMESLLQGVKIVTEASPKLEVLNSAIASFLECDDEV